LDWSRGWQLALQGLTKTLQQISGLGERGAADLLHRLENPLPWLLPGHPWTWHLPDSRLWCHLPQYCSIGTVKAAICDPLPEASGGIVHAVIEPPAASLHGGYHQAVPMTR
jgi:hypothetical protein